MSTPLTQLTNPQNTDENNEIVGEIINEMNNSDHQSHSNNPENNDDLYTNNQNAHLERQMDTGANIISGDNLNNISNNNIDNNNLNNIDNNFRPAMHIDTFPEVSLKDRILSTIKEPTSVALIYFLLSLFFLLIFIFLRGRKVRYDQTYSFPDSQAFLPQYTGVFCPVVDDSTPAQRTV